MSSSHTSIVSEALQRQLRASEASFRVAFEQAPVGMVVTEISDTDERRVVRTNQAFADFLGMSIDELIGSSPASFSHPDDDALDQAATRLQISGEATSYVMDKRYQRSDGTYVWGQLHTTVIDEPGSQVRSRLSHVVDISAQRAELERRNRAEHLGQSIADLAIVLFKEMRPEATVDRVATDVATVLEASGCAVLVVPPSGGGLLTIGRFGEIPAELLQRTSKYEANGEIVTAVDIEELFGEGPGEIGSTDNSDPASGQLVSVALRTEAVLTGWLVLCRAPGSPRFTTTDLELLHGYADRLALLFELARVRADQQRLSVLEDRERIARDLHDTVIQDLFAVGMQISGHVARLADVDLQERFESVIDQIDVTIRRLRTAVFRLNDRVSSSDDRCLSDELTATLAEASRILGHEPTMRIVGAPDDVHDRISAELLPTLREALSNIARHANASATTVGLTIDQDAITLAIDDNGIGIDPVAKRGNGIANMAQRAAALGGSTTVTRRPEGGSRLEWVVPSTPR